MGTAQGEAKFGLFQAGVGGKPPRAEFSRLGPEISLGRSSPSLGSAPGVPHRGGRPHPAPPRAGSLCAPRPPPGHFGGAGAEQGRAGELPAPPACPPRALCVSRAPARQVFPVEIGKGWCHFPGGEEPSSGTGSTAGGWDEPGQGHAPAAAKPRPDPDPQGHRKSQVEKGPLETCWGPRGALGWEGAPAPRPQGHPGTPGLGTLLFLAVTRGGHGDTRTRTPLCRAGITALPGSCFHPQLASAPVSQSITGGAEPSPPCPWPQVAQGWGQRGAGRL